MKGFLLFFIVSSILSFFPFFLNAWFDETHIVIAKVAGCSKHFNSAGPDIIKEELGNKDGHGREKTNRFQISEL